MLISKVTSTQASIHIILEIVHVPTIQIATSPFAHKDQLWVHKSEESLNKLEVLKKHIIKNLLVQTLFAHC